MNIARRMALSLAVPLCASLGQVTGSGEAVFFDSTGYSDAIRIAMTNVSTPVPGKSYFAWLGLDNDLDYIALGELAVLGGNVLHVFKHPDDSNLVGLGKKILITEEAVPFSGTSPTIAATVFADSLHGPGVPDENSPLRRIRNVLVRFTQTAGNLGLGIWLLKHIPEFVNHAGFAKSAAVNNQVGGAKTHSDHVYDFIVGNLSGLISNNSIASNDDPIGYGYRRYADLDTTHATPLGGTGYHLRLATESPLASERMKRSGSSALIALKNAVGNTSDSGWALEVTDQALKILTGNYTAGTLGLQGTLLYDLVQKFLYGTVGADDTSSSTGGIVQAYIHAQRMASFSLDPVPVSTVSGNTDRQPFQFSLHQNYPNPFNASTVIPFSMSRDGVVTLSVYDILGRRIATLLDSQRLSAGDHVVRWEGSGASGFYLYRLETFQPAHRTLSRGMFIVR